jgi:hypothetical protein
MCQIKGLHIQDLSRENALGRPAWEEVDRKNGSFHDVMAYVNSHNLSAINKQRKRCSKFNKVNF